MISDAFSKTKDGLYRNNVGVVLLNSQKKIFVGKRYAPPTAVSSWQMPQGGISESESEEEALIREIKEEVGIFPNTFSIKNCTYR